MSPADCVIAVFGGVTAAARVAGCDKSRVCRWRLPRERGGTAGRVPERYWPLFLAAARERRKHLTEDHLRKGRVDIVVRRIIRADLARSAARVGA